MNMQSHNKYSIIDQVTIRYLALSTYNNRGPVLYILEF